MRWPWRHMKIQTNSSINRTIIRSYARAYSTWSLKSVGHRQANRRNDRLVKTLKKSPSKFPIYKRQIRICHVRFVTLNSVIIQLAVLHRISEMVATDATVWIAKLRTRAIFTVRCWAPRVDHRRRRRRRRCLHCNDHAQTPWIEGVKCRCSRRNASLATTTSTSAVAGTVIRPSEFMRHFCFKSFILLWICLPASWYVIRGHFCDWSFNILTCILPKTRVDGYFNGMAI